MLRRTILGGAIFIGSLNCYVFGRSEFLKMNLYLRDIDPRGSIARSDKYPNPITINGVQFNGKNCYQQIVVTDEALKVGANNSLTSDIAFYDLSQIPENKDKMAIALIPDDADIISNKDLYNHTNKIIVGSFCDIRRHPILNSQSGRIQAIFVQKYDGVYENLRNPTFDATLIYTNCGKRNMNKVHNPLHFWLLSLYMPRFF